MNNFKKVGLTALAGSLAAVSANAAEMSVSGATLLTYTSEDGTEVTGNPFGMKTNLSFTASGDVNGMTVSYMQASKDQFAGMSSARLSIDMGDMGTLAFDQGSGSGLGTIDDKTPTAAEEIWDGIDTDGTNGSHGLVGVAGASGVWNYVNTFGGVTFNGALRTGAGAKNTDGSSSGAAGRFGFEGGSTRAPRLRRARPGDRRAVASARAALLRGRARAPRRPRALIRGAPGVAARLDPGAAGAHRAEPGRGAREAAEEVLM